MSHPAQHPGRPEGRRARACTGVGELDADLRQALRRTSHVRRCFYAVVLTVALAGQVSGAVQTLGIPLLWAVPAVAGLELGGIVVLANADVRRRLGERAAGSRLLSALTAAWAVAFNWLAHPDHLLGGFFAGMSALGYCVWWMHTENQRRDRLRATGDLPPTAPAYQLVEHWLAHPRLTLRARSLARADPELGLYDSLALARQQIRRERRQRAISTVLHRKIRAAVDPVTADIAVSVYDLDEIAQRLAGQADYDTLTALISADLAPARLTQPPAATAAEPKQVTPHSGDAGDHDPTRDQAANTAEPPGRTTDRVDLVPARRPVPAQPVDAAAAASPVRPTGTTAEPAQPPAEVYQPVSDEDAAMYQAWRRGLGTGREPTGADLARAAGRANDASGVGRKAARRYRQAHAVAARVAVPAGRLTDSQDTAGHQGSAPTSLNSHRSQGAAA